MDKSQGELDITSARVTAFVSPSLEDSTTVFCFEVHPIGSKKSPWILRGHTEVYLALESVHVAHCSH